MKRTLLLTGLWIIVLASFLEISFYLITGKGVGLQSGTPTISNILSPTAFGPYIKQAEENKTFYVQRLDDFSNNFNSVVSSKSSFVKTAEATYTLGGTVSQISTVPGTNNLTGYDITLKNSRGDTFVVQITSLEAQFTKVFLRTPSSNDILRSSKTFADIKVGNYLIIKRSTNLLNPAEVNIDVEILSN